MNQYGQMAQDYWREWLPTSYNEIEDPTEFFSSLGQRIQDQVTHLWVQLAGDDPGGETWLQKTGRLTNAKMRAEEIVLRDWLPPDPDEEEQAPDPVSSEPAWIPLVEDPTHPFWQEVAEQEALEREIREQEAREQGEQSSG